jgi:hypothetical protein
MADTGKRVSTTGGQFEDDAKIKPRQFWTKMKECAGWIKKTWFYKAILHSGSSPI